jgi:leucyl-tRNA synthetase
LLKEFNLDSDEVNAIKAISMIQVDEFGEHPAIELVDRMTVKDQRDPKAEEATKLLYKKEFHGGVLKKICGKYAGRKVHEVKEELIHDFKRRDIADSMYDLPQPVICRCLTPCIVKVWEEQWFIKYSDETWKEETKAALRQAAIYPEAARQWFLNVIDWLREWPCARKSGLGTPLPWSSGWIVETLTDSTVYMAFYTINKQIRAYGVTAEQLTDEVFDYIFYGNGDLNKITEQSRVKRALLEEMRNEFLYWYPVDLRISAKELLPNHLTFFLFQHIALFPAHLPKGIGVNGLLRIDGKKMSKSKGNFVTLRDAIERYSSDATRCALLLGGEGMDDPDWRTESGQDVKNKLQSFYTLAKKIVETEKEARTGYLEAWLLSVLQRRIKTVTENLETLKTRTALETALFEVWKDFRWYTRRRQKLTSRTLREALSVWIRLLAPFAPHLGEEIWNALGKQGFVSLAEWPTHDIKKVNIKAEETESLIKNVLEDTLKVLRVTNIEPTEVCYYSAAPWKWKVYLKVIRMSIPGKINLGHLMKETMSDPALREMAGKVAKFAGQLVEEANRMPKDRKQRLLEIGVIDENEVLTEAAAFLGRELQAKIYTGQEDAPELHDPGGKAMLARPYRPAIYVM